jgi:hypothetical protein
MTFRILITVLAVLALCFSMAIAKEDPKPAKFQTNSQNSNPNWDLKAQLSGENRPPDPITNEDPDNPNSIDLAIQPVAGMAAGDDCSNPIGVDLTVLPLTLAGETTCLALNNDTATCLGYYDGGEDRFYKLTVGSQLTIKITMTPAAAQTYTGWAISTTCPLGYSCVDKNTNSAATPYTKTVTFPSAGTYYMMVDTWPSPTCITSYTLLFETPPPPPANDNCANAIPIGTVTDLALTNISDATFDGPGTFVNNRNIWYCYTADCTGMATASLCGSSYDTKIQIWDNCTCPPTLVLASNDNGCTAPGSTSASKASWDAVAAHQYLIEIGPYSATTVVGTGMLTTSCIVPPTGATCGNPVPITINPSVFPLTVSGQTNCGYYNIYSNTCLGSYDGGEDIIYRLDVTQPVYMEVTMDPKTSTYTGFLIDDACPPDPVTCLYKKTSSTAVIYSQGGISLVPGTYWLMVDTYPSPTCIPNFDIKFDVSPGPPPNDNCAGATPIGNVTNLAFNTGSASFDGPGGFIASPNLWYCYTASCDGAVTASLCGSSYDTRIRVFDGCACPLSTTSLVEDDDACDPGLQSAVTFAAVAGNTYLIEVGGYSASTGLGVLTTSCAVAPPNDDCEDVTPVALTSGVPAVFTGNNAGSTPDCVSFPGNNAWLAFTLPTCMNVTLNYCGTTPAFGNAWLNLTTACPCAGFTPAGVYNVVDCGDGNVTIKWEFMSAGTYYYPILSEAGAMGPYTINVTGVECPPDAYCSASGTTCDEYISHVAVGTIDNYSGCSNYEDWTALSTSMTQGSGYPIIVENGYPYTSDQCGIWVDFNHDFDFTDAGEMITVSGTPGGGPYTANIIPPCGGFVGPTTMRIRIMYTGTLSPCGPSAYGEVEDYTLDIQAPPVAPPLAVIHPNPQYVYYRYALNPVMDTFFVGQFDDGYTAPDVNLASVTVNGLAPTSVAVLAGYSGFYCQVLRVIMPLRTFIGLGALVGTTNTTFTVAGTFTDASEFSIAGNVTIIGKAEIGPSYIIPSDVVVLPGDFNLDGMTNVTDAAAIVNFIFADGAAPTNLSIGDLDCNGMVNISDVVSYIAWIFGNGAGPTLCGGK